MGSLGRSVGSNGLFFIRKIYTIGELINAIEKIVATFPGIHTACGLSNISYGLPGRKFLNLVFMTMAIAKGLDGAIINPLDS